MISLMRTLSPRNSALCKFENSESAEELQHGDDPDHDPRQAGAYGDPADGFLLEGVKPLAEPCELSLHPVASVFAAHDDF